MGVSLDFHPPPGVAELMRKLNGDGAESRYVGGAVRDCLLGAPVVDVDIATTMHPQETMERLSRAGLRPLGIGVDHGSVKAIVEAAGGVRTTVEITSLRTDAATDGRHAIVAFGRDWDEDARRRDFTINALYLDMEGRLYDPLGGLADLRARRVRFIGDARRRIAEDYLRILRYFRFQAHYGDGRAEEAALCGDMRAGLARLSRERIRDELLKILGLPTMPAALEAMAAARILPEILPQASSLERASELARLEVEEFLSPDPLLRLGALSMGGDPSPEGDIGERPPEDDIGETPPKDDIGEKSPEGDIAETNAARGDETAAALAQRPAQQLAQQLAQRLAQRLALSKAWRSRLEKMSVARPRIDAELKFRDLRRLVALYGRETMRDRIKLAWARDRVCGVDVMAHRHRAMLNHVERVTLPDFPFDGAALMAAGMAPGPALGAALKTLRAWWIACDFPSDPECLRRRLEGLIAERGGEV